MPEGVQINGKVLAELRSLAGMEQLDLANASCIENPACRLTPQNISAYEREVKRPGAVNLDTIVKALKQGLAMRGLAWDPSYLRALIRTPTLDGQSSSGSTGEEDPANRRQAGRIIALVGLAAGLAPSDALERMTSPVDRSVDATLIAGHEDLADVLASRAHTTRLDVLLGQVAHHADVLLGLLDSSMTAGDRRRLEAIAIGAHVQAGLSAFGLGDRSGARRFFATAWSLADESNDAVLCAQTLGVAAVLHSPIESGGRGGDSRKAVSVMTQAVHYGRRADPATHAYALRWLGLELAAAGDERGFHRSFEAAERLPQSLVTSDGHGFLARYYAGPPEQVSNRGIGLVRVGRPNEAMDVLEPTLCPDAPRWTAMMLADLAAAWVLQEDPEQACYELDRAMDFALDSGYAMGLQRILGVRSRLPESWKPLPCVRQLDERLRT